MTRLRDILFNWHSSHSSAPLAVYRISFGILMLFSTIRFLANGWVDQFYIQPKFHFSYLGFDWIPYPSATALYLIFGLMILSALFITLGFLYRFATISFFLSFTYIELLDKTTYLNHYYFVSLVALLLIFIPANKYFSLDAKFGWVKSSGTTAKWHISILKFQIAVVYIFAGIAKLEPDWLFNAQPLKYWLHTAHHWEFFGDILKQDWVAYLFSWFGCIYDLTIVLFLSMKSTRKFAYVFVLIFHLLTWMLFPIGVFPWVMMVGTLIFFPVDLHQKIIGFIRSLFKWKPLPETFSAPVSVSRRKLANTLLGCYIALQILIPFRYLLYPGNLFWTEQGFRFSWRVMLMEKAGHATFYIKDAEDGKEIEVKNCDYLTPMQEKMMSTQPDMILEFAHFLKEEYKDTTIERYGTPLQFKNPEVHAEIYVALNSRPHQLYVDKKYNLATIQNDLSHRYWLEPLTE